MNKPQQDDDRIDGPKSQAVNINPYWQKRLEFLRKLWIEQSPGGCQKLTQGDVVHGLISGFFAIDDRDTETMAKIGKLHA